MTHDGATAAVVRVRYAETDQMGVVYYGNYLTWFEVGRTEWLRSRGWTYREMEADGRRLPVVEAHCTYRQSARYDDEIEIRTQGELLSAARIRFVYEVIRRGDDTSLAHGYTVHAVTDPTGRPRRLPDRVRSLFA
ncbi:MAG: thioesterase family protein [Acidobacteriota bacterium]